LVIAVAVFGSLLPDFFSLTSLSDLGRQVAEFGLIVLGLSIVLMSGGIDLSVSSIFTLSVLFSLIGANVEAWPVPVVLLMVLALQCERDALPLLIRPSVNLSNSLPHTR